jgi:drug/metabolite transporter (DMT)-like permease
MIFGPAARAAAGIALLSVMDAIIKAMAGHYPVFEIAFLRYIGGVVVVTGVLAIVRPGWPSLKTLKANALRSVVAVVTATAFFYALGQLPLAETLVLSFLSPMFIALFSALLLKERVDGRIILALAAGFAGTLVVVFGQAGGEGVEHARSWPGVAAALLAAIAYAFSLVLLRQRAQLDPLLHIVAIQNFGPAVLVSPLAASVWQAPAGDHVAWFLVMGALGVTGHILMATAYAKAEAPRLATLEYTALIWATVLGYAVFGEVPTMATLIGGALIIGAAIMASRR